ncbi:zinc finger protein 383-like [Ctenocephalides felis]|uniref:zinc finger protein 383-like n=1 Tax=Ctenocephalides felis TaxID=7515 RepID=UPI000E6E388A|nr:zinc finger protein 383-like [Ctenocephalides felis]
MFDDLCRLCSQPHYEKALEIFSKQYVENSVTLGVMIQKCINIEIDENDRLPFKICQECHYKLLMYYAFQQQCEYVNCQFRQKLILEQNLDEKPRQPNQVIQEVPITSDKEKSKDESISFSKMVPQIENEQESIKTSSQKDISKVPQFKENQESANNINKHNSPISMCYLCGALVKRIHSHMKAHRDAEKPKLKKYKCEKCGAAFSRSNHLNIHLKTHLDVKPLQCTLCDKRFIAKRYLDKHMNVHAGMRPWKCQFCSKAFQTKYNLNTHVRVHTREKPFKCPFCEQCFRQRAALNLHVRAHRNTNVN